jgi:hypothetical protein
LLPVRTVPQNITLSWGNHQPGDIVRLSLTGPAHFPDNAITLDLTLTHSSGRFDVQIFADEGAKPGDGFVLDIDSGRARLRRPGSIGSALYLPVLFGK